MLAGSQPGDGGVVGTVAYMSPEQTRGGIVNQRTNVWSLGVVLHEMLFGRRPFRAADDTALIYAIRYDNWAAAVNVHCELPSGVSRILERCLAKDPPERYGDAGELLRDLGTLDSAAAPASGAAATRARRSRALAGNAVAVLAMLTAGFCICSVARNRWRHKRSASKLA